MALTLNGISSFAVDATPRWTPRGYDLDGLTIAMSGPYSALNAYVDSLAKWSASSLDSNMFLESWDSDGDKHWPTVSLHYTGKKGGIVSSTIQKSVTAPTSVATYVQDDDNTLSLTYRVPTETITSIERTAMPQIGMLQLEATTATPVIEYAYRKGNTLGAGMTVDQMRDTYFAKEAVDVPTAEELVPDQYWRCTIQRTVVLLPLFS